MFTLGIALSVIGFILPNQRVFKAGILVLCLDAFLTVVTLVAMHG